MCAAAESADIVMAETPVNPTLDVVDLHARGIICRSRGATLVVGVAKVAGTGGAPCRLLALL